MLKKAIEEIYLSVINVILNDIEEKDIKEVADNYLKYLYSMYSDKEFNEQNYSKMVSVLSRIEYDKWVKRDKKSKLFYFKKDESFDIISSLSQKAFSLASMRLEGKKMAVSQEEIDKDISILISRLDSVEDFNREEAERLVSEGILDFEYTLGRNDNITSFRLGHIKSI